MADDAEKDLKKLVGTWEEVSHTANGKAKGVDELKGQTVVIDASSKWEALKDGTVIVKETVNLDPAQKAEGGRPDHRGFGRGGQEHLRVGRGHLEALLLTEGAATGVRVQRGQRGLLRRLRAEEVTAAGPAVGPVGPDAGVRRPPPATATWFLALPGKMGVRPSR